ncbi:hypothetical protein LTR16_007882, partial [Cryomyces antarcticus]
ALHLGHEQPLHSVQILAHPLHHLAPLLSPRHRRANRRLRVSTGDVAAVRGEVSEAVRQYD